jgi:A/G-specific adenine glycosylase
MTDFNKLVRWYKQFGRDLPWRQSANPYHIWLSEVILQQTRVEQGLPWYYSFVENFPEVCDLAHANEDQVLKLWQGLGYYSRARNLRTAAIEVCKNHQGRFPDTPAALQQLKGIGPYTAAAIASFAFNYPAIALDGNLLRIASRYYLIKDPVDKKSTQNIVNEFLANEMKGFVSADFNQALMDLGALICTPANPKCPECPLNEGCKARVLGLTAELPVKQNKTKVKEVHIWYFIFKRKNQILVRKRENKGIWQNMYDFPSVETTESLDIQQSLPLLGLSTPPDQLNIHVFATPYLHILSHRKLKVSFALVMDSGLNNVASASWVSEDEFQNLAIPRLIDKFLAENGPMIWSE